MRTYQTLSAVVLTAAGVLTGALYANAATPAAKAAVATACDTQAQGCNRAKPEKVIRKSVERGAATQHSRFNAETCNRLQNRVERDTCLNHAEAWV